MRPIDYGCAKNIGPLQREPEKRADETRDGANHQRQRREHRQIAL